LLLASLAYSPFLIFVLQKYQLEWLGAMTIVKRKIDFPHAFGGAFRDSMPEDSPEKRNYLLGENCLN
jgi:hypothetical protein